jgi:hypothetical protein
MPEEEEAIHCRAVKRPLLFAALAALVFAAGAAAAYRVSTIYLKPGACTRVAKTRVCARKVAPTTVTTAGSPVGQTIKGNGSETLAPITLRHGVEVHWTAQFDSMGFNYFTVSSGPGDTAPVEFDNGNDGTSGQSYVGPGTYTLSVSASGAWTLSF